MKPIPTREALLEQAFSDIPSIIGDYTLRPLSAGSFTLLGRLGNSMIVGKKASGDAVPEEDSQAAMFAAVIQYVWIHSAPLERVLQIREAKDIPEAELAAIGFTLTIGQAFAFLLGYQQSALRMTGGLAEVEPEESEDTGKRLGRLRAGSPASSTPSERVDIPFGSDTSSGSCPSSEPSPTSMPPMSPTALDADGASLTLLPDLAETAPQS